MSQIATTENLGLEAKALIMLGCAAFYVYAFKLNFYFFESLNFSQGVNWVFIPSGLRLLFVLVFLEAGAIGVIAGSIFINYTIFQPENFQHIIVTGLISGASPLLALAVSRRIFSLDSTLSGFTTQTLFKVSVLFALFSSVLHQGWFFVVGDTDNFIINSAVMALGDWFGTVLVIATAAWALKFFRFLANK
jgi:ABC-type glycerol-3-phosphate transport system permease component